MIRLFTGDAMTVRRVVIQSLLLLLVTSCSRQASFDLTLLEPCGQNGQALGSARSFRLVSSNLGDPDSVRFTKEQAQAGSPALAISAADAAVVTLEAYQDDVTVSTDDSTLPTPVAVGRLLPFVVGEGTDNVTANMLVGRVDSFGGPRDEAGTCTTLGGTPAGRHGHTATYLPRINKILVVGGAVWIDDAANPGNKIESLLKTVELIDPATGAVEKLPDLFATRAYHTATAFSDGRVLLLGGVSLITSRPQTVNTAVLVDLSVVNAPYGSENLIVRQPRIHHTATLIDDRYVVLIGGCATSQGATTQGCTSTSAGTTTGGGAGPSTNLVTAVEVFDVTTETSVAGPPLGEGRAFHATALLGGNVLLVSGGANAGGALSDFEFFKMDAGVVSAPAATSTPLSSGRLRHQIVVQNPESIAIVGGQTIAAAGVLGTDAGTDEITRCIFTVGSLQCTPDPVRLTTARYGHHAVWLRDNTMLVVGGVAAGNGGAAGSEHIELGIGPIGSHLPMQGGARDRGALAILGGDSLSGSFVNQVLFVGGHDVARTDSAAVDMYFGR
jgi:Galactose oxidase, central domain